MKTMFYQFFFFFQAEDGIRDGTVTGVQTCALPISGGHGMMWGPAVARIAVDLALRGRTEILDIQELGLDRFDAEGRSRLAPAPVALPVPVAAGEETPAGAT